MVKKLSERNKIKIQHSKNSGESSVRQYKIDGYCKENNTYYEFHGCLFHGCQKCYKSDTFNPNKQELMSTTYKRHLNRINYIKESITGNLVEIWECELDALITENEILNKFVESTNIRSPLNPGDALFGGRTNGIKLYYKCKQGEEIKYKDFTSLYPSVQKYCPYPVGHPNIVTENFGDVRKYFGLIKCKILPPKKPASFAS
ncbi:unnamed protein product [Brachionus calyciflorus]|uniref:DNA-directed DNA polymerase n=1 Tax=Brachionus calyciflorus TaxID=104777 RepID=A0A814NBJ5_9BILA|nr:unnamed protein product [Brachionus calyciflorus]